MPEGSENIDRMAKALERYVKRIEHGDPDERDNPYGPYMKLMMRLGKSDKDRRLIKWGLIKAGAKKTVVVEAKRLIDESHGVEA